MPTLDLAALATNQTTLSAVSTSLPWESELSVLATEDPDFADATVLVIDGDLDGANLDVFLDNLYPNDLDHPLPFMLLVRGSMRVRRVVNTDADGGTHLVVFGDVHADFMITLDQETIVGGDLQLRRAWWGTGEAGLLIVRGVITAPALIADGYRIDDERFRLRQGVSTTAFLWTDGTDYLPREHVLSAFADEYVEAELDEDTNCVVDWVDVVDVLDAVQDGRDPFADPITDPAADRFVPDPDLLDHPADALVSRFHHEVSADTVAAVLTDPLVLEQCMSYDDDLIDGELEYSARRATDTAHARLTIMRVISDPEQLYRFHHFEPRETAAGAIHIDLRTQEALGTEQDVVLVGTHDVTHYVDALSCFRRLRTFLAHTA